MMIERKLENDLADVFKNMPELSDTQIICSREIAQVGKTKVEDDTKTTIVAVACGFRQNDAFSLSPINISVSVTIMTRAELDSTSEKHDTVVEAIADRISYFHKFGLVMSQLFTNEKFYAGELRMDGGTPRTYDSNTCTWSDTINFSIRGSEKFQ